ncbi:MAG: hypothetical protein RBQ97_11350 [Acholeplasma sp.]|nr:hypothetical protein [Acholeplasma sp.]
MNIREETNKIGEKLNLNGEEMKKELIKPLVENDDYLVQCYGGESGLVNQVIGDVIAGEILRELPDDNKI